jgi:hypothetical protein
MLIWWLFGGLVIPAALPAWIPCILFPVGPVVFGWFAVEVGRTAAARIGYRWGRESSIIQFYVGRAGGTFLAISFLFGSFMMAFAAFVAVVGPWLKVAMFGIAVLVASMGITTLLCAWTRRS